MRKTFILILLLISGYLLQASSWDTTSLTCNDYKYTAPSSYGNYTVSGADRQIYVCDSGNHVVAASPLNVWNWLQATNTNLKYTGGGENWVSSWYRVGGDAALPLTLSSHTFYILWSTIPCGSSSCASLSNNSVCTQAIDPIYPPDYAGYTWKSNLTVFPIYSVCPPPTLQIVNSTIQSDRYYFAFNVTNPYSLNWNCTFKALGTTGNYYEQKFSANTIINLLFSTFPKQHTNGRITCWYQSSSTGVTLFKDFMWIIDMGIYYNIYDLNLTIGKASPDPPHLPPYSTLNYLDFFLLSQIDKATFNYPVVATLSSPANISTLNCSGTTNFSTTLQKPTGTALTSFYQLPVNITCNNPVDVPLTLSIYTEDNMQLLDTASFNVSWTTGNIVIDNVNLIKDYNSSTIRLWATVSNEYTGTPINDNSNLACNYSILTTQGSFFYTGEMAENNTYAENSGELQQSDMLAEVDNLTGWNLGGLALTQINCSAADYNNKSQNNNRWVFLKRIKTFRCSVITAPPYTLTYSINDYQTDQFQLYCEVIFDTENNSAESSAPLQWLENETPSASLQLHTNILSGGISHTCKSPLNLAWYPYGTNIGMQGATSSNIIDSVHAEDNICNIIPLSSLGVSKISDNLVEFTIGYPYNKWLYSSTTAVITFDLQHLQRPQINTPVLQIVNNKTENPTIAEINDTISCSVGIIDPNHLISRIEFNLYDSENLLGSLIGIPLHPVCNIGASSYNPTTSASAVWYFNPNTCGFLKVPNQNGKIVCVVKTYTYIQNAWSDEKWSNPLEWQTSSGLPTTCEGGYCQNKTVAEQTNNTCIQFMIRPSEEGFTTCKDDMIASLIGFVASNFIGFIVMVFLLILLEPYILVFFKFIFSLILKNLGESEEGEE